MRFLQSLQVEVAGDTSVYISAVLKNDLFNFNSGIQASLRLSCVGGFGGLVLVIAPLKSAPLLIVIFQRGDGQEDQHRHAKPCKMLRTHIPASGNDAHQGHTQVQEGPRKNVPIKVNMTATSAKMVKSVSASFPLRREPAPNPLWIAIDIRYDDESKNHECRHYDSPDEGRVADQFLKAQKIPGGLGRIRRFSRICQFFQRRVKPPGDRY